MRYPAQEVILGALLTFGAFAMGMTLSSAGAPSAHDATQHAEAFKLGEFLTAVATAILVVVTYLLYRATETLADATKALAATAKEDSHNRKVLATADAWWKLRARLDLPQLTEAHPGKVVVSQLGELEGFCQIVNSGDYDLGTLSKMSGGWFMRQIGKVMPYIQARHSDNPNTYKEIIHLAKTIKSLPSNLSKSTEGE